MRRVLLIGFLISVAPDLWAQESVADKAVSITQEGAIKSILERITREYEVHFSYTDDVIAQLATVKKISVEMMPLQDVLARLLNRTGIEFKEISGSIVLTYTAPKEGIIVTGLVQDESGTTLPGVSVMVVGTYLGTLTNASGNFGIRLPAGYSEIKFSLIGLQEQILTVTESKKDIVIVLKESSQTLSEIVITGYNVEKERTEMVGSVTQLDGKDLQADRPIESFDKMLNGKVAGLQVENNAGGEAGLTPAVRIRGQGTLVSSSTLKRTSSSEPLYILDGVPLYDITEVQDGDLNALNQRINPLASLNPADIESISVLKDASASAIYGANAANGVIVITTKRGQAGKLKINAGVSHGFTKTVNNVRLLNTAQYVELYRETLINSGISAEEADTRVGPTDVYTSWEDITLRTAQFSSANIDLQGGNEAIRIFSSLNYTKQETVSMGNDFEKFSARTNVDVQFSDALRMSYSSGFSFFFQNSLGGFFARNAPPNLSPYNPDGTFNETGFFENLPNPLSALAQNENNHRGSSLNSGLRFTYLPLPNLSATGFFGIDLYRNRQRAYDSKFNASGRNSNGQLSIANRENFKWVANTQVRWGKKFGPHSISTLGGAEAQNQYTEALKANASNFLFDNLRTVQAAQDSYASSSEEEVSTLSYFGEVSYDYRSKYFISVNTRTDASSVFGGDVRQATFASLGTSWNLHEEAFLKQQKNLQVVKLRASFGSTGNSRIGSYAARGLYVIDTQYGYGNEGGVVPSTAANPGLTWEKNYKLNVGLDLTLFSRLNTTVEYYRNSIQDAISTIDVPYESGFIIGDVNAADMRNEGIELSIAYDVLKDRKLAWNVSFNAATNRNVITRSKIREEEFNSNGVGFVVGEDVRTIYGVKYAGVDPATGKPLFYLKDGSITDDYSLANLAKNRQPIGTRNPKIFGGITNQVSYKNFSLSIFASYSAGSDFLISNLYETDGRQISFLNQSVNLLDRWQRPGQITNIPRLHQSNQAYIIMSRYVYNNDHIKVENISLNYAFPKSLIQKVYLTKASAFAQVNNVGYFYFDKRRSDRNSIAEYRYLFPEGRTFTMGVTISL
jgi:TonB-dependent starch-binding outer membrane protein SusC